MTDMTTPYDSAAKRRTMTLTSSTISGGEASVSGRISGVAGQRTRANSRTTSIASSSHSKISPFDGPYSSLMEPARRDS